MALPRIWMYAANGFREQIEAGEIPEPGYIGRGGSSGSQAIQPAVTRPGGGNAIAPIPMQDIRGGDPAPRCGAEWQASGTGNVLLTLARM